MSEPSTNLHVTFDEWNQDYYLQTEDRVTVGIAYGGNDTGDAPGIENAYLWAAAPLMQAALEAEEAAQWYYAASIGGLLDEYGRELCKRADQLRREALAASRPPALSEVTPG